MTPFDMAGYVAAGRVISAFCMKEIVPMRLLAIGSKIAFLINGTEVGLAPVWMLHSILLPINGWRLGQAVCHRRGFRRQAPADWTRSRLRFRK